MIRFSSLLTLVSVRFEKRGEWSEDEFWEGRHLVRLDPFCLPLSRLVKLERPEEHKEEESSLADQLDEAYARHQAALDRITLQYKDRLLRTLSRKSWTWVSWWRCTLLVGSLRRRRTIERGAEGGERS